ncbi:MAG: hypothetical protein KBC48_01175 [Candidatus Pacebacteria bacterium]|nr:hypothetical protein [Candidatus Paceibacterota bacterium]
MKASVKKVVGIVLFVIGILLLITPFTPGSFIFLILGVELLGFDEKLKGWFKR